jgi:hypothetical protein
MQLNIVDQYNRKLEVHYGEWEAQRAVHILNAHEIKNGRTAKYKVESIVKLIPLDELNLPNWAMEAITNG